MAEGDEYRVKAADFHKMALEETNTGRRNDLLSLAQCYLRLAEQANRNARPNIVYETPASRPHIQQQQQQPQVTAGEPGE